MTLRIHTNDIRQDDTGWSIWCDGIALWKGLTREAAETILNILEANSVAMFYM